MCCLLVFGEARSALAESKIDPDRPDVSNSTKTVRPGAFQIEAGVAYERSSVGGSPAERRLAIETTLRAGLTDRLEVQLGGEPFVRLRGAEEDTGHGDLTLGLKYRFLDARAGAWWPSLGVQPFVKLPIASDPIGTERPDFAAIALASFDLPWELGLDVNAGPALVGHSRPSGYLIQARTSASLSRELTEKLSSFIEIVFASRAEREGRDAVGLDAGLLYALTPILTLDLAIETSLAGPGPDWGLRAGLSVRFGR